MRAALDTATVQTSAGYADRVYFLPGTVEYVTQVIRRVSPRERPPCPPMQHGLAASAVQHPVTPLSPRTSRPAFGPRLGQCRVNPQRLSDLVSAGAGSALGLLATGLLVVVCKKLRAKKRFGANL